MKDVSTSSMCCLHQRQEVNQPPIFYHASDARVVANLGGGMGSQYNRLDIVLT